MKLISSIVRRDKVDAIRRALGCRQVCAVTVRDVHDHAPQRYETTVWLGHEYNVGFALKSEVTVAVHARRVLRS